jgi:hypothetical protein
MKGMTKKLVAIIICGVAPFVNAGVISGSNTLDGGSRWNADYFDISGIGERSLDGGLRYSLQGGSMSAYRDLFSWNLLPSEQDFTNAVQGAFDVWSSVDPVSGLGSDLSFVSDFSSNVQGILGGGSNIAGAEIDLFGVNDAYFWDPGNNRNQGETWVSTKSTLATLTSGTTNYQARSISGVDIYLNNNSNAVYTLDVFSRLLMHEIGHGLGLRDVESNISSSFIDDNFDPNDPVNTLNNSWASLVNVYDPKSSPLSVYNIGNATSVSGVDLLMESNGLGISVGNPLGNQNPLTNDEYGMRQFLYPFIASNTQDPTTVPEPSTFILFIFAVLLMNRKRLLKRK